MQEEDDEWGAFGGGADRSITAEPTDPPRDVPTAHGDGVEGPSVTPVVGDRSVQDDADFADFAFWSDEGSDDRSDGLGSDEGPTETTDAFLVTSFRRDFSTRARYAASASASNRIDDTET